MGEVLSGELKNTLSVSIAFVWTNTEWANPKPLYKQKERTKRFIAEMSSLFLLVKFSLPRK